MSIPERAGWYDDPEDETRLRYFDGVVWTQHRVPRRTRTAEPAPATEVHPSPPQPVPARDVFGRPSGSPTGPHQQPGATWSPASTEPTTGDGQPLAGYGSRVGAYIIDGVVLGLLNVLVTGWAWWLFIEDYWTFVYEAARRGDAEAVNALTPDQLLGMLDMKYMVIATGLSLLLLAVYQVGFLATRAATPGKIALGLSVRRTDRPGRLGVGTAFMRVLLPLLIGLFSLLPVVSLLTWLVWLTDVVWPLKDPRRQALHDKIAGTQVVVGRQPKGRS